MTVTGLDGRRRLHHHRALTTNLVEAGLRMSGTGHVPTAIANGVMEKARPRDGAGHQGRLQQGP
ncbi:hypothetical protein ABZ345_16605 [Lentzea sp. NPDC005914]|uniref:hypothetical protein n=1 Tax=Lentzea sp. NPDC005914 TaxID=3154572 RepID=UPI0033E17860